jgi:hypothetical protein
MKTNYAGLPSVVSPSHSLLLGMQEKEAKDHPSLLEWSLLLLIFAILALVRNNLDRLTLSRNL